MAQRGLKWRLSSPWAGQGHGHPTLQCSAAPALINSRHMEGSGVKILEQTLGAEGEMSALWT